MKIIKSAGKVSSDILVDDDDYDYFNQWRWKLDAYGYPVRGVYDHICTNGKRLYKDIKLHRLVARARLGETVDHINHNTLDNRKENLRLCTQSNNAKNTVMPKTNTSGYKGVSFIKHINKFEAYIGVNGTKLNLGYHIDKKDAARAYNKAAVEYFGEYAFLNTIADDDIQ